MNACGIIWVTLMPITLNIFEVFTSSYRPMYMIPFDDFLLGRPNAARELVLNFIMLMPLGFMIPWVYEKNFVNSLFTVYLTSLAIELLQPLLSSHRASDITDLIVNTLGGLVGILIYYVYDRFKNTKKGR